MTDLPCQLESLARELIEARHARRASVVLAAVSYINLLETRLPEKINMLVAAELTAYKAKAAADAKTIEDLNAKLAAITPAPSPDHVLDDADVAAVKQAQADLNLNADGTPVTPPVPPA